MSGFQYSLPPIVVSPFSQPVSALAFDPVSDVLWAGTGSGHVSAHCGTQGLRGVCFRAGDNAVQKIVAGESYVRAASNRGSGVGSWAKGGMNKWYHRTLSSITTFASSSSSPNVAVATINNELLLLNAMTGSVSREIQTPSLVTHLEFSHSLLLSGAADGYLRTHDPRTGIIHNSGSESSVKAHYSGIQGLQTVGNFVFTIGLSLRQGRPFPDPLVKVYDLRNLRPLPPVPFSSSPAFINVVPKRSSSVAVTSNQGLINIVDATNLSVAPEFYQLDLTSYVTSVAVSPTGAYIACGDAEGMIHMRSQAEEGNSMPLNGFEGQPVEWADTAEPLPDIEWNDSTPLNMIGLPHYKTQLLSAWTPQFAMSSVYYPPPQKIPPQILNSIKTNDNVAYATLPKELKGKRNMVIQGPRKGNPRFRSGKSRDSENEPETPVLDLTGEEVPKMYRQVEIEYSKFGVEDFDFAFYNKTEYSGLETHILNSYTNPILQVMHYSLPIRGLAKSHITTNCIREHCLLCELGFVVRMLEDAKGTNCQSSNFCKTVGVLAQLSNAIDLIDYGREPREIDYSHMIQSFHRFMVDHLSLEGNAFPQNPILVKESSFKYDNHNPAPAPVTQLLGIDAKNIITCLSCKAVREKENMTHIVDLIYPRRNINGTLPSADFETILRDSLLRKMSHKATCQTCKHFSTFSSRRSIPTKDLPPILAVNACVNSEDNFAYWFNNRNQTFLRPQIKLHGQIGEMDDAEDAVYELRAVIVQIINKDERTHLVAIVKVPDAEHRENEAGSPWYIFNDFVVRNVPEEEALSFPDRWKVPAVLHFERVDRRGSLDFSGLPTEIDPTILCRDTSISLNRDPTLIKHECLEPGELPKPGTLVAIDAEFVSMQQEETEFRSDGTKKVIRPARLSLARVSVLRGDEGPKQGVPFIDDHIHTSELIVDYLTEFSGIRFGDLDPHRSPFTLTPLKVVYKKLRLLVDRGCIFVGHGLSKDFRIINIFVPPEQVIDTVDLYYLKGRQRRLSLRFLSWFVLHEHIQTDTHDSIEDARSALNLYKAYYDFEAQGVFDQKLEELYKEGRQYNFKPPPLETPSSSPSQERRMDSPQRMERANRVTLSPSKSSSYPSSQAGTPIPTFQSLREFVPRSTRR
ncbi:poly(A)-specific ribonuclease [Stygiomarasmius scandens]|uniref:PAN2-PAN3 deadenylation complex catalytic subunit PAN2 n=1 Tax=Marasmiellus scandens TaxID=2682957 RepID=A0ABR1J8I7_9AGAR